MVDIPIFVAFFAGLVSFLAPCVLPLIPGYMLYLGKVAHGSTARGVSVARSTFLASVFFVSGFALVFALLGLVVYGFFLRVNPELHGIFVRVGGAMVVFFGLYLMGLMSVPFIARSLRIPFVEKLRKVHGAGYGSAFLFGVAFALGWTPCVGASLGALVGVVALVPGKAFVLLLAYALGLGVPFLVVGFFAERINKYVFGSLVWVRYLNIAFGAVLVFLGVFSFTQNPLLCQSSMWGF